MIIVEQVHRIVLPNGLRVLVRQMAHRHLFSANLRVAAGLRHETPAQHGISHFVEHLVFEREKVDRVPGDLNPINQIEGWGGDLVGGVNVECASYWINVPHTHWWDAVSLWLAMLNNLDFTAATLERERTIVLDEIAAQGVYLDHRLNDLLRLALWPGHILGKSIVGSPQVVQTLSETDLLAYHSQRYSAPHMVLAMAGQLDVKQLVERLEADVSNVTGETATPFLSLPVPPGLPAFQFDADEDSDLLHVLLAFFMAPMDHPRRAVHLLAQTILGDGLGSRLHIGLRTQEGLLYEFYTDKEELVEGCLFKIYAAFHPAKTKAVLQAIWEVLLTMGHQPLSDKEFQRARERFLGKLWIATDDPDYHARWLSTAELLTGSLCPAEALAEQLETSTPEELRQICAQTFVPQRAALVAWGPPQARAPLARSISERV
jgi:predicted Zn-dependent peptidase